MALPPSRRLDFSEIPLIDAGRLIAGDDDAATVAALDRACTDVGFFYVKNHGVAQRLIDELALQAARFFTRPMDEKLSIVVNPQMRGYLPLNYESAIGDAGVGTSRQEGFWIGRERSAGAPSPLDGPNRWLASEPHLAPAMLAYFDAVEALGRVLLRAFALALGYSPTYFDAWFSAPQSRLKLNHYPPQDAPHDASDIGVVGHSDSGGFTILWQDDNGGLEVQSKNGDWVGAPPLPGTFVINIGNVMQIWTGGRFSSTPHRVVNRSGNDRYSVPLFVNPNYDVPVDGRPFADYQTDIWQRIFPVAFATA